MKLTTPHVRVSLCEARSWSAGIATIDLTRVPAVGELIVCGDRAQGPIFRVLEVRHFRQDVLPGYPVVAADCRVDRICEDLHDGSQS